MMSQASSEDDALHMEVLRGIPPPSSKTGAASISGKSEAIHVTSPKLVVTPEGEILADESFKESSSSFFPTGKSGGKDAVRGKTNAEFQRRLVAPFPVLAPVVPGVGGESRRTRPRQVLDFSTEEKSGKNKHASYEENGEERKTSCTSPRQQKIEKESSGGIGSSGAAVSGREPHIEELVRHPPESSNVSPFRFVYPTTGNRGGSAEILNQQGAARSGGLATGVVTATTRRMNATCPQSRIVRAPCDNAVDASLQHVASPPPARPLTSQQPTTTTPTGSPSAQQLHVVGGADGKAGTRLQEAASNSMASSSPAYGRSPASTAACGSGRHSEGRTPLATNTKKDETGRRASWIELHEEWNVDGAMGDEESNGFEELNKSIHVVIDRLGDEIPLSQKFSLISQYVDGFFREDDALEAISRPSKNIHESVASLCSQIGGWSQSSKGPTREITWENCARLLWHTYDFEEIADWETLQNGLAPPPPPKPSVVTKRAQKMRENAGSGRDINSQSPRSAHFKQDEDEDAEEKFPVFRKRIAPLLRTIFSCKVRDGNIKDFARKELSLVLSKIPLLWREVGVDTRMERDSLKETVAHTSEIFERESRAHENIVTFWKGYCLRRVMKGWQGYVIAAKQKRKEQEDNLLLNRSSMSLQEQIKEKGQKISALNEKINSIQKQYDVDMGAWQKKYDASGKKIAGLQQDLSESRQEIEQLKGKIMTLDAKREFLDNELKRQQQLSKQRKLSLQDSYMTVTGDRKGSSGPRPRNSRKKSSSGGLGEESSTKGKSSSSSEQPTSAVGSASESKVKESPPAEKSDTTDTNNKKDETEGGENINSTPASTLDQDTGKSETAASATSDSPSGKKNVKEVSIVEPPSSSSVAVDEKHHDGNESVEEEEEDEEEDFESPFAPAGPNAQKERNSAALLEAVVELLEDFCDAVARFYPLEDTYDYLGNRRVSLRMFSRNTKQEEDDGNKTPRLWKRLYDRVMASAAASSASGSSSGTATATTFGAVEHCHEERVSCLMLDQKQIASVTAHSQDSKMGRELDFPDTAGLPDLIDLLVAINVVCSSFPYEASPVTLERSEPRRIKLLRDRVRDAWHRARMMETLRTRLCFEVGLEMMKL